MKTNRRKFFQQIFAAGVFTAACPHISLGRLTPELIDKGDSLTGIYHVKISEFPVLKDLWGSVRMAVEGIPPEFNYPKIIVSQVDPDYYQNQYTTVSEACPHEGYPIELLNDAFVPDPLFECVKGHGSLYLPDGTYYWGVSRKNLLVYETTWDGGDNLFVEIPALITSVIEENIPDLMYMSEFYPNPAKDSTTLKYGLEKQMNIRISLFNMNGEEVRVFTSSMAPAGHHEAVIDVTNLPAGAYFCKMKIQSRNMIVRKLQVVG